MNFETMRAILAAQIPARAKVLAVYLLDLQGDNGHAWPGWRTIRRECNMATETIKKAMAELEDAKILSKKSPVSLGRRNTNSYTIHADRSTWVERSTRVERNRSTRVEHTHPSSTHYPPITSSEAVKLAELLLALIIERKPDFRKPNMKTWAAEVDRMIRLDKRTGERIEAVIMWSQADNFWRDNILSTAKLRKQFDQLELKMENGRNSKTSGGSKQNNRPSPRESFDQLQSNRGNICKVG
ncbi:MAG: helix-turn-helix domain-containing protein [Phycisphaerae bacterium]|nr:helix-turn-helix domain-containing protein [Phycisphaerae bacterium]